MLGDPVHRRSLEVDVAPARDGRRAVRAHLVDRRLQGFTFTGGRTMGPGPVHDMSAQFELDVASGKLAQASGAMAVPAFEGSAATRHESCRDILPNLGGLAGARVDDELNGRVRAAIGRERGCYHLTNLVHAAVPVLLRVVRERFPPEVGLHRMLELAASEIEAPAVRLHGLLVDQAGPDRFRRARLGFRIDPSDAGGPEAEAADGMRLLEVAAEGAPDLEPDPQAAARLEGMPLLAGFAPAAVARLGDDPARAELLDLALALNAIVTQAFVLVPRDGAVRPPTRPNRALGTCYMWRSGGPLEFSPSGKLRSPAGSGAPDSSEASR